MTNTAERSLTDARFLSVLAAVTDQVVDETTPSINGEVWNAYRDSPEDAPYDHVPDFIPPAQWISEKVAAALAAPATQQDTIRAMLAARARLGENLHLIADINLYRVRDSLRRLIRNQGAGDAVAPPADHLDEFETLLDFVAEVRRLAKDI